MQPDRLIEAAFPAGPSRLGRAERQVRPSSDRSARGILGRQSRHDLAADALDRGVMAVGAGLDRVTKVAQQMPSVADLDGLGRALAYTIGIGTGPIPGHHLDAGMLLQPGGQRLRLTVGQEVEHAVPLKYRCAQCVGPRRTRWSGCRRTASGCCRSCGIRPTLAPMSGAGTSGIPPGAMPAQLLPRRFGLPSSIGRFACATPIPGTSAGEEFMSNRKRLADNATRQGPARPGAPRRGLALLQGIACWGRCGRRMVLHYSGLHGDYPVYHCRADRARNGQRLCQEVRALQVDTEIERILLGALAPDQIALAAAAIGRVEAEVQMLERQWSLRRERARYEAVRAQRQYDAVEPENRLVARSLERAWEEALRRVEEVDQAYAAWRREQPGPVSATERAEVLALAEDLPRVWQRATPVERKQILRLVVREVMLDQKRTPGQVWIRIVWQTGAASEHLPQRKVQSYRECSSAEQLQRRVRELNSAGKVDREVADALNAEKVMSARGTPFRGETIHLLRKRWGVPAARINGASPNPPQWPDGSYSVQGATEALHVTAQTIFKWLRKGRLSGHQSAKGQPWQIHLTGDRIAALAPEAGRNRQSKREAS